MQNFQFTMRASTHVVLTMLITLRYHKNVPGHDGDEYIYVCGTRSARDCARPILCFSYCIALDE